MVAKPSGIDVLDRRQPQQVAARLRRAAGVLGFLARIAAQILVGAELQRIDENRRNHPVGGLAAFLDQLEMAGMERAHGRDQRHASAAKRGQRLCQFFTATNGLHASSPSDRSFERAALARVPGKRSRGVRALGQPHFIIFANEKGGTGKSTTAVHTAIALAASGHRVAALDLDSRQRTMARYLENRDATIAPARAGSAARGL